MADAIMLSPETYEGLRTLINDYVEGYTRNILVGRDLKLEETGTGYSKIGIDLDALIKDIQTIIISGGGGGVFKTIDLDVCVDGSPETHTFVIADSS